MPCEIKSRSAAKHHGSEVPKSLSAHDCLIGVDDEQLRNGGGGETNRLGGGGGDHLLPPRNPNSLRQNSNVKPRGWYATRKSYRSVAYKTWTVGGARKLLNGRSDFLPDSSSPVPNGGGSVSDSEDKYYSAVESDLEDSRCTVAGCGGSCGGGAGPRKCVSTEVFYAPSSAGNFNNNNNNNNNHFSSRESFSLLAAPDSSRSSNNKDVSYPQPSQRYGENGTKSYLDSSSLLGSNDRRSRYPDPSPGCSDQEETDCYSSADYCKFTQKRNGFRQNRIVRSFDALDSSATNEEYETSSLSARGASFDEELRTVIDTFQDLRNLRKNQQNAVAKRSRSPFANTSQALVKKIQQVLPNLHIITPKSLSNNGGGTCKSNHEVDLPRSSGDLLDIYDPHCNNITNNSNNNIHNNSNNNSFNEEPPPTYIDSNNYSFSNSEEALEYLKNELVNIRQRDFLILQQLRHVENVINTKKLSNKDLADGATSSSSVDNIGATCRTNGVFDDHESIPVPKCLSSSTTNTNNNNIII